MNNLSASQMQAVNHFQGPCCVIAGPGSGKTVVITQRTYNLIYKHQVDPSEILVITFTKAAALEMKERFLKITGESKSRVTFGTFHAVFFMILKAAYHFEVSNIITEEQKYMFMREIVARHHLEYRDEHEFINSLLSDISRIKNENDTASAWDIDHCSKDVFKKIFEAYDKRLRENRLLDFDDMLVYTYALFKERKDILTAWQNKYKYILIDEFQDINALQYAIVRMLAKPRDNLFIVGDDDQSIYRFRGSKPEIMLSFGDDYPKASKILLETNYRSDAYITQGALQLIGHNKKRFFKEICAGREGKNSIQYLKFVSQEMQNQYVIEAIIKGIEAGEKYENYAILFRTNTQPGLLMEQMMQHNIPFKTKEKIHNIYTHWIAKDILTYIRIAQKSQNRADFLQIMNKPKRYIGRDSLYEAEVNWEHWKQYYNRQPWVAEHIVRLEYDLKMLRTMRPYAAINYIRHGIGYDAYIREYAVYRNINVQELYDIMDEVQMSAKGHKSYEQWQQHIEKYTQELKQQNTMANENQASVLLATMHASKGLEFKYVYIVDVNEGIIPYKKAALESEIEEERRLFYVGMTRAKDKLTLCSVNSIHNKDMEDSRFLQEIFQS